MYLLCSCGKIFYGKQAHLSANLKHFSIPGHEIVKRVTYLNSLPSITQLCPKNHATKEGIEVMCLECHYRWIYYGIFQDHGMIKCNRCGSIRIKRTEKIKYDNVNKKIISTEVI